VGNAYISSSTIRTNIPDNSIIEKYSQTVQADSLKIIKKNFDLSLFIPAHFVYDKENI
jgi:hypothetical protein